MPSDNAMKMICRIAVALSVLVSGAQAVAANWVVIASSDNGSDYSADASSIRTKAAVPYLRPFAVVTIWTRGDHSRDRTKAARETKSLYSIDCDGQRMATLSEVAYDPQGLVIRSYNDSTDSEHDYEPVIPDTIGSAIMSAACATR